MAHRDAPDHQGQAHEHQGDADAHMTRGDPPRGHLRPVHGMSQRRILDMKLLLQIAQHLLLTLR